MGEAKRKKRGMSRQRNRGSVLQAMVPNSATHIYRENNLTFDISINKLSDHNFDPCTITGKYS
jgi:hypothetical protein